MSSQKKRAPSATNNPFDSDSYSVSDASHGISELSRQSRGVAFDLNTIAASRRAMISGKPLANKATEKAISSGSGNNIPLTSPATTTGKVKRKFTPARRVVIDPDLEAGCDRQRTLNESTRESDAGAADKNPTMLNDEDIDNPSSSSVSSNGSDDESESDANSYDSIDDLKKRRSSCVYAILGLVSLGFLAGIIALSVIVFGGKDGGSPSTAILTARQEALHGIIKTVVDASILMDQEAPQYRAHRWLIYEDLLGLAPASGASHERVVQRYSLAVFFFATGGARKWKSHNWLDGDECIEEWDGVGCTDDGIVRVLSLSEYQSNINGRS